MNELASHILTANGRNSMFFVRFSVDLPCDAPAHPARQLAVPTVAEESLER